MLKNAASEADAVRMFMPCSEEPAVEQAAIVAFCASLNTPVVNIEALEVGLARAGIMLAAGNLGELQLLVRVSLIPSGPGITFKFQGDPTEFGAEIGALEAALSFSEGMGFLFEDDLLGRGDRGGRQRAAKIWASLCGRLERVDPEPGESEPAAAAALASTVLTKFRRGSDARGPLSTFSGR